MVKNKKYNKKYNKESTNNPYKSINIILLICSILLLSLIFIKRNDNILLNDSFTNEKSFEYYREKRKYYNENRYLKTPYMSVCVPCYPRDTHKLKNLIKSINNQTILPDLIIIGHSEFNDNQAKKLMNNYINNKVKVKVVNTEKKQFAAGNRNMAAYANTNDYITFIDADDVMFPNRIEVLKLIIKKYKPYSILHNYTSDPNYKYNYNIMDIKLGKEMYDIGKADKDTIHLTSVAVHHAHITIHKNTFKYVKQNNKEKYFRREDSKFVRDILKHYGKDDKTLVYINIPLTYYTPAIN